MERTASLPQMIKTLYGVILLTISLPTIVSAQTLAGHGQAVPVTTAVPTPTYLVGLNKTEIVRLPYQTNAIIVGNPEIADITVHSANTILIIGRSFGETNMVIMDKNNQLILNATLQVADKLPQNGIRLHFGNGDRETYNCSPECVTAPTLGDSPEFRSRNTNIANGVSGSGTANNPSGENVDFDFQVGDVSGS